MSVYCPHCNSATITASDAAETVVCESCGKHIDQDELATIQESQNERKFGRFVLIAPLGKGAFGTVWQARDTQLDRLVAIKIPHRDSLTREQMEPFHREARAVAQLKHPNIVGVHESGIEDDTVYIVCSYIEGQTLSDRLNSGPVSLLQVVDFTEQLANGIHHAHSHGVIHRDLKPGNILVNRSDVLHIADFGLAKRESGDQTISSEGQLLGTPAYMSPEQAGGDAHLADGRTDIYALGVIMFQMLAGRLPFEGQSRQIMQQTLNVEPPDPRQFVKNVPRPLAAIALKCLEKQADHRYQTAEELSEDLGRWKAGVPVHAAGRNWKYRAGRFVARHARTIVIVSLCLLLGFGAALFVAARPDPIAELRRQEIERAVKRARSTEPRVMLNPSPKRVTRSSLSRPDMSAFELVERRQTVDLRMWQPVALRDRKVALSPVLLTSRERFRKLSEADSLVREARTSGLDIHSEAVTRSMDHRILASDERVNVGATIMKARQIEFDVSAIRVGEEFDVEGRRTYWNGFQPPDSDWVGSMIYQPVLYVSFLAIFPEDRPFKSYRLIRAEIDGEGTAPYEGEQLILKDDDRTWLYWEIANPEPGYVYQVHWEWAGD